MQGIVKHLNRLHLLSQMCGIPLYIKINDKIRDLTNSTFRVLIENSKEYLDIQKSIKDEQSLFICIDNNILKQINSDYNFESKFEYNTNNQVRIKTKFSIEDSHFIVFTKYISKDTTTTTKLYNLASLINDIIIYFLQDYTEKQQLSKANSTTISVISNLQKLLHVSIYDKFDLIKDIESVDNNHQSRSLITIEIRDFKLLEETFSLTKTETLSTNVYRFIYLLFSSYTYTKVYKLSSSVFSVIVNETNKKDVQECINYLAYLTSAQEIEDTMFHCMYNVSFISGKYLNNKDNILSLIHSTLDYSSTLVPNTVVEYDESFVLTTEKCSKIREELYRAMNNGEIQVYYQPKVKVDTEKIIGFEALARWIKPNGEVIPPSKFIPVIEKDAGNTLINRLGLCIFKQVCDTLSDWKERDVPLVKISINMSVKQLQTDDFVNKIIETILLSGIDSKYLDLEITESTLLESKCDVLDRIDRVRKCGFTLSLDDFGTGYSSLAVLQQVPVDYLKIDKKFIDNISSSKTLVPFIIAMAHSLGLNVIAEGVEQEKQLIKLQDMHCDEIQGFIYSKAVPKAEAENLLKNGLNSKS